MMRNENGGNVSGGRAWFDWLAVNESVDEEEEASVLTEAFVWMG